MRKLSTSRTAIAALCTLPMLYPFAFLVGTALKTQPNFTSDAAGFPQELTFSNFTYAWRQADLGAGALHSLIAVGVGVIVTVGISALGAFWFFLRKGKAARVLRITLIGTMALPPPIFIIPLYVLLSDLNLTNNLIVLGLVYAAWNSSFGLYLVYAYLQRGLPPEVLEAARVDGAGMWQTFRRIAMPLLRPAIATLSVLTFVWSWSDLLMALVIIQNATSRTLIPATALLTNRFNTDIPGNAAAVVIALIPMLVVFLLGQRFLQRGILAGVGK
jgi:ABC-type glycerol-3-phosphate transport system permease component